VEEVIPNIDDFIEDTPFEFTCPGCGRHIVAIAMYKVNAPVCGACMCSPGWPFIPELRKAFDPFGDTCDENLITMSPVEIECRALILQATLRWAGMRVRIIEDYEDDITNKWIH